MKNWTKTLLLLLVMAGTASAQTRITQASVIQLSVQPTAPGNPPINTGYFYLNSSNQLACTLPDGTSCISSGGGAPTGPAGGDLGSTYPNPIVTATHLASALPIPQGGTAAATLTAHSFMVGEGTSAIAFLTSPATNGNCVVSFNVSAAATVDPTCALSGVAVNAQSGSYALLYSDRASYIKESGGTTATLTLPQVTGITASNMPFVTQNLNSGNETIAANAADKIDNSGTGGSITVLPNFVAFVYQDSSSAPGNWWSAQVPNFAAFGPTCATALTWNTSSGFGCGSSSGSTTVYLTSTYTTSDASIHALPGLTFDFPANTAATYVIDCYGAYSQASTGTAQTISYQSVTTAATTIDTTDIAGTAVGTGRFGGTHNATPNTSATQLGVTFTPGSTAIVLPLEMHLSVLQPSGADTAFNLLWTAVSGGTDLVTVYPLTHCTMRSH